MLIDLDVVPATAPPRERRRPWWRPVALAVVPLLLLGGAAATARPMVFQQVADTGGRPAAATLLDPRALYTVQDAPGGDGVEVAARPLVAGGPSWRVWAALATNGSVRLSRAGTALVVSDDQTVKIVDAATGRDRWELDSGAALIQGDQVVIRGDGVLKLADLETGRVRWSQPGEALSAKLDPSGRYLFTVTVVGSLIAQVRSVADGRLLATHPLPGKGVSLGESPIIGDRVYLFGLSDLTVLRLGDLTPVWSAPADVLSPASIVACGDLDCVSGEQGTTALDPATGEPRWTAPNWLAYSGGIARRVDGHTVVADPATGRVLRDLGRGEAVDDLMLRADRDRTQVTDLRTGHVYGALTGVTPFGCVAAGDFLACRKDGGTTVWKVPRTAS
ncbi:PQQ-binding-like beta-propeller repeat protein [Actinoplanes sp. L3-i22]|uniref:outer membrane protein assembly factor BamB family protein n=1 Tax=Actinoplanes sp. L3-i22 TaxID=2836373 RepID=UPI001C84742D|nr:PQQ-binding-like beta-propeller repeat protein [Actinoplanes sp. L3-i22]